VILHTAEGDQVLSVRPKSGGSAGCGNRSVKLIGGRDDRTGYWRQLPDVVTPRLCILDYARTRDCPALLRAIRKATPEEGDGVPANDEAQTGRDRDFRMGRLQVANPSRSR
jgi:hypothetical protein